MEARFGCRVRLNLLLTENQGRSAKSVHFINYNWQNDALATNNCVKRDLINKPGNKLIRY
jgi:hypothetical protein